MPCLGDWSSENPLLCLILEGVSQCVCVVRVYRDLHHDLRVCLCARTGLCCYILQSSSRTMVTTNAFFLATHAPLLSANHNGETPPSRPMVQLPCLHAPRRQGPWLSIQGSGARETRGGGKEGETGGGGDEAIMSWKGFRMHSGIEHLGLRWTGTFRPQIVLNTLTSRLWIHVMDTHLTSHVFASLV